MHKLLSAWYKKFGRNKLPWRTVRNPYYTVVSEFMLQQTQVDRVIPKFEAFIARFPNFAALAKASIADVLREWKGLGYNSRAVRLKKLADAVRKKYAGKMPREEEALRALPGVGPYTVSAVRAFAFDEDDAACDVNIRRIVHRMLFGVEYPPKATLRELHERAKAMVSHGKAHDWNSAMMDLGSTICTARAPKCLICPLREHCAASPIDASRLDTLRKQYARKLGPRSTLKFEHTTRYARGRIIDRLRELPPGKAISLLDLHRDLTPSLNGRNVEEVDEIVAALRRDGLVTVSGKKIRLQE